MNPFGLLKHRISRRFGIALGISILVIPIAGAAAVALENARNGEPGTRGDGGALLINNRTVTPAGTQSALGDLPLNEVLAPDGKHLLVTNGGADIQSLQVVSTDGGKVEQTIQYFAPHSVFVGLAYSSDGTRAYASGGGEEVVHTFTVAADGALSKDGDIPVGTTDVNGIAIDNAFPTGLSLSPDGKWIYVADNLDNDVAVIDVASKKVLKRIALNKGDYPYTTLFSRDGGTAFASDWGSATLSVINTATGTVTGSIKVGQHPSAMALGAGSILYVTDGNSDAVSVVDTSTNKQLSEVSVSPYTHAPLSSSPVHLAVSPDGKRLYVVDAGADEVSVIGLKANGVPDGVLGRIPTAWYPTSIAVSKDGKTLFVTNGKGVGAGPNDSGFYPNPTRPTAPFTDAIGGYADGYCQCTFNNYTGSMIVGTLSTIGVPSGPRLDLYTEQVARDNHYGDQSVLQRSAGNPIPLPGRSSPIKHVIYIIKENRTYDQVFGDLKLGDGHADLALFPRSATPNEHALVERFGILDNFYADAEVSADGHNWVMSANASDYNEKAWPQDYSPGAGRNRGYDFEGVSTINLSAGGYLWDAAAKKGVNLRDYGEFAFNGAFMGKLSGSAATTCPGPIAHSYVTVGTPIPALLPGEVYCFGPTTVNPATTPNLVGTVDPKMRAYDLRYPEADRLAEWRREFTNFEASNTMPALEIMRLPNDHTAGTRPGFPTPQAYISTNDQAVGGLIETLSHSKDWASTAVFITEDDAQNGPDHVDSHRTTSLVISPYTSREDVRVDHTLYDSAAMVRTMELILGLDPLSQFDANAVPMWRLFSSHADLRPYTTASAVSANENNTAESFGATQSEAMDFSAEDRAPMDQLNEVIWGSVKGDTPYPGSTGAADG